MADGAVSDGVVPALLPLPSRPWRGRRSPGDGGASSAASTVRGVNVALLVPIPLLLLPRTEAAAATTDPVEERRCEVPLFSGVGLRLRDRWPAAAVCFASSCPLLDERRELTGHSPEAHTAVTTRSERPAARTGPLKDDDIASCSVDRGGAGNAPSVRFGRRGTPSRPGGGDAPPTAAAGRDADADGGGCGGCRGTMCSAPAVLAVERRRVALDDHTLGPTCVPSRSSSGESAEREPSPKGIVVEVSPRTVGHTVLLAVKAATELDLEPCVCHVALTARSTQPSALTSVPVVESVIIVEEVLPLSDSRASRDPISPAGAVSVLELRCRRVEEGSSLSALGCDIVADPSAAVMVDKYADVGVCSGSSLGNDVPFADTKDVSRGRPASRPTLPRRDEDAGVFASVIDRSSAIAERRARYAGSSITRTAPGSGGSALLPDDAAVAATAVDADDAAVTSLR